MRTDGQDLYKRVIDRLVHSCRDGQGQIAAQKVREGVWNPNASAKRLQDQHEVNLLLKRMADKDRDVVARILAEAFVSGVHETFVTLCEEKAKPFDDGYEGGPAQDFIGRLDDWEWPESR